MKHLVRAVKVIVVLALLYFLGRFVASRWSEVSAESFSFSLLPFLASLALLLAFYLLYGLSWMRLLRTLVPTLSIGTIPLFRILFLSFLLRYLPAGKVWNVGSRIEATHRAGAPRSRVVASILYEQLYFMGGAVILALVAVAIRPPVDLHPAFAGARYLALLLILGFSGLLVFAPARLMALAGRLLRKDSLGAPDASLPLPEVLSLFFRFLLVNLAQGCAAWFMLLAVLPGLADRSELVPLVVAGYPVSRLLGQLALVMPGGLGIREGAYAFLLSTHLAVRPIVLSSALLRLVAVAMELTLLGVVKVLRGRSAPKSGPPAP